MLQSAFIKSDEAIALSTYGIRTVKLWDVKTGECLKTLQRHTSSELAITFSPNGQLLASGGYEPTIKLWQVSTGDLQTLPGHTNRVCCFQP